MSLKFNPGYYAKIRIDDEGKIVDVTDLEATDLPQHTHHITDIVESELNNKLENKILEILSTFFANNGDCSVKFTYDKNTKTVSADVDIDDITITKNEYGQLISTNSETTISQDPENPNQASNINIDESLNEINKKLDLFKQSIPELIHNSLSTTFANNKDSAVVFNWDEITKTYSADLKYDGISISKDEFGDLIATGATTGGEGTNCASHTHLHSQIEDFDEAVINIFNDYSKNIDLDLVRIVDGVTIKVNNYGQLCAVGTYALEKHTHSLTDIVDYIPPIAAAKQMMSDLEDDTALKDGVIDFSKLNIGYSILALSKYLQDVVNENLKYLSKKIDNISVSSSDINSSGGGVNLLSIHEDAITNILYDKVSGINRQVYYAPSLYLCLSFIPYNSGEIILLKGNIEIARANVSDLLYTGNTSGRFSVEKRYLKNEYVAFRKIKIDIRDLLIGDTYGNFQICFQVDNNKIYTNTIGIYSSSNKELSLKFIDTSETHQIGTNTYYNYPKRLTYQIKIQNYENIRFVNTSAGFVDGVLTGLADQSKTINIPNLFTDTEVNLIFNYEEEHSESYLYKHLANIYGGTIANDILKPTLNTCRAYFSIPGSELCNSVKIRDYSNTLDIKSVFLTKGKLRAYGLNQANLHTETGNVELARGKCYILSFLNKYDSGEDEIELVLDAKKENIDISRLEAIPCNI